jgi:hypothetical protein
MNILVLSSQWTFKYYPHNTHFRIILIMNNFVLSSQWSLALSSQWTDLYYPHNCLYYSRWTVSYYPHKSRIIKMKFRIILTMNIFVLSSQWTFSYYPHNERFRIILTMNRFVLTSQWMVSYYPHKQHFRIILTMNGLEGPGIESRWRVKFSSPALGPTQPPLQRVPSHSRG